MPNPCQFGSEPAYSAPTYYQFSGTDVTDAMGSWYSMATNGAPAEAMLDLLGIPIRPILVADFVVDPPEFDFPVASDFASLAVPTLAALDGSYRRFKNLILANAWTRLSQCKNAPVPSFPSDPPEGFISLVRQLPVSWIDPDADGTILEVLGQIPAGALDVAVRFTATSGPLPRIELFGSYVPVVVGTTIMDSRYSAGASFVLGVTGTGVGNWSAPGVLLDNRRPLFYVGLEAFQQPGGIGDTTVPQTGFLDVAYKPASIGVIPTPPVVVDPPTDFPVPVTPPACTLDSICAAINKLAAKLEAMDARVQHIAAAQVPPAVLADRPPVLAQPVDPTLPPGTPDTPLQPILKPFDAVGAIIQCTTVPASTARYGTDPLYFPFLLHVVPVTADGPLAGERVTRNPQVILNLPAQVESLALDPGPGVIASIQWLRAPK